MLFRSLPLFVYTLSLLSRSLSASPFLPSSLAPRPLSPRLAESLYQRVKRVFGDPHQATEDLKEEVTGKLGDHQAQLEEAQALITEAQGKSRLAVALAKQNQANLTTLEVSFDTQKYSITQTHKHIQIQNHTNTHSQMHTHMLLTNLKMYRKTCSVELEFLGCQIGRDSEVARFADSVPVLLSRGRGML